MAQQANIYIDAGTDFVIQVQVTTSTGAIQDITGATFAAQMKKFSGSTTSYTFVCSIVSASQGIVQMVMNNTLTSAIPAGRYNYDLEMTLAGLKTRVIEGQAIVSPEMTQV